MTPIRRVQLGAVANRQAPTATRAGTLRPRGIAAAVISLLAGDRLWRRGQTVFAQGIIGLGLALLYLSIYAAAILYQLV